MKNDKKEISVSESRTITVIRTCAMFCIILCHYFAFFEGFEPVSQLLNVGVPIFFIISGFLYGQKRITSALQWYKKQFIKIIIPLYTYYLISGLFLLAVGKFGELNFFEFLKQLLNLQGICGGEIGNIQTGHLWFITFILICYLITPLLQLLREKLNLLKVALLIVVVSFVWIAIILNINNVYFISWFPGILSYIFAYYLAAYWKRDNKKLFVFCGSIVLAFCSVAIRLYVKRIVDHGNEALGQLYDCVFVPYSQCFLAFGLFFILFYTCLKVDRLIASLSKILKVFDRYSYYVYIVHYMFVEGVVALNLFVDNIFIVSLLFVLLTIVYSIVLR